MTKPLVKSIAMSAATLAIFTVTFAALFMRSKNTFVEILTAAAAVPTVVSPSAKAAAEHKQFVYWNFRTNEVNNMIKDLADERAALVEKQANFAAEEARITAERKENERIRDEIARSRKELSDYIIEVKSGDVARLKEEVTILSNMAPESIVSVFNEKSDTEVVKVLAQMKPDMVALILEAMMAQPAEANAPTPQKRAATILEMMKRYRETEEKAQAK